MSRYFIAWAGGKGLLDLWWCCAFMPGKWRTQATLRRRSKWSVSFWSICIYVADYFPASLEYCILQVTSLQEPYKHFIYHSKHVSLRNMHGKFHNTKQLISITNKLKNMEHGQSVNEGFLWALSRYFILWCMINLPRFGQSFVHLIFSWCVWL